MAETTSPPQQNDSDAVGWESVAKAMHGWHPALQEHAARNLAERGVEISPEHHQAHIDISRPTVPNIDELPPEEQDLIGEIIEIGEEALEGAGLDAPEPTESYANSEIFSERINEALTSCEVEMTLEVREAIKGFYEDHYSFADIIRKAVDGTLTLEECDAILDKNVGVIIAHEDVESYKAPPRSGNFSSVELPSANHATTLLVAVVKEQLENADDTRASELRKATLIHASLLIEQLFNESSLPITTTGEAETKIISDLFDKIAATSISEFSDASFVGDALQWDSGYTYASSKSKQDLIEQVEQTRSEFWSDTRMAGQLLYHNTGHLDDISKNGGLMSRLEQQRRNGTMNTTTGEAEFGLHHSVVPHFTEIYDAWGYKTKGRGRGVRAEDGHVTTGTIAVPLAKIIQAAPYARDAQYAVVKAKSDGTLAKVPVHDTVGHTGVGGADEPGEHGGDRVFFASPTQSGDTAPDEYVIKNGGPQMPENRNTFIFFGDEEITSSPTYGIGEQFPDRLHIQDEGSAARLIKDLQNRYIQLSQGKIVVPLRRGVFDFLPENMEWAPGYRAPQTKSYRAEK